MTRTGPNDASGVVWAIGEYFFIFLRVFLSANYCFMIYTVVIYEVRYREAGNDENGPKRRQTRRLGHR
jgi:hypothetical protein